MKKNPSFASDRFIARDLIHLLIWGILIILVFEEAAFSQDVKIPKLLRHVTDFTNTLSAGELDAVEQDLARFEDSTSTQLVVVMIPTIGSESIEDFALRTAELNGVGEKKKDNGVLLLIVKDDRKMRIEVGYGLEGVLPDGLAGQIIRREITPYLRSGDYFSGIKAGIAAIMLATRNEYKAEPKRKTTDLSWIFGLLFFAFIFYMMMHRARRSMGTMRGGRIPMYYVGGFPHSRSSWGSSGGGSGRSGFGGFSGGGGSFGGGGASGSW
jgi:uncharacterized protein